MLGRLERLQPRPALDARLNPERRFICHFPQDNTIWSVGSRLRRQRPARQEVPRAAHRQLPRQARRLARRAHARSSASKPRGRDDLRRRGVPQRLRQDELRDDDPAEALQGLEDLDRRRRHRVDARRPGRAALGHQPGSGLLRRRAGHELRDEPERDEDDRAGHDLHERRADAGRRRLVGGQGRRRRRQSSSTGRGGRGRRDRRRRRRIRTAASPRR